MNDEDSDERGDGLADKRIGVVEVFLAMAIRLDDIENGDDDATIKRDIGDGTEEREKAAHFLDGWEKMRDDTRNEERNGKTDGAFGKICICFEGLFC